MPMPHFRRRAAMNEPSPSPSPAAEESPGPLTICVFGGARTGHSGAAVLAASRLGTELALRGHRLVYGAGGIGVMGAVALAASAGGAQVTGIVPRFLYERERAQNAAVDEYVITED